MEQKVRKYKHLKTLFVRKDDERLIARFAKQCKAEGVSFSAKVSHLINDYMKGK